MRTRAVLTLRRLSTLACWERQLASAAPSAAFYLTASHHYQATPPLFTSSHSHHRHVIQHHHSYSTTVSPTGGDVAQQILAAEDLSNLSHIIPVIESLDPSGLPAVARAAAVSNISDKNFKDALVNAAVRGLPALSTADLCSVVESLSELGAYSVSFKDATADQILARLSEFSGDMLGHALRCFGRMQYYDDELLEGVVSHVAAHPDKFSAENIADIVYAFSKCGFCHPDIVAVVEKVGEMLLEEAEYDKGEAIASIVDAYSRVGCSDPDVVDDLVMKVAEKPMLLSGEALSKLVVGTIRLGNEDQHIITSLLDAITSKLPEISPKHAVKIIGALGELGLCHRSFLDAVTEKMIPDRMNEFTESGLSDLVHGLNKLGYYNTGFMSLLEKQGVGVNNKEQVMG